jgi:hypothetical protein
MDQLIDGANIAGEVADKLSVESALLQRRPAQFPVMLDGFAHLANVKGVGAEFE